MENEAPVNPSMSGPEGAAHEFVALSEQFLVDFLQHPFDMKDIALFAQVAGGSLIASMYAILRKEWGPAKSEEWLRKTLSFISSWVRFRGSDAMLKFEVTVKDAENNLDVKPIQVSAPPVKTPSPPCFCNLDSSGRCPECSNMLTTTFKNLFENMRAIEEAQRRSSKACVSCRVTQSDRILSTFVPTALDVVKHAKPEERESLARETLIFFQQLASSQGVTDLPLTQKAFQESLPS